MPGIFVPFRTMLWPAKESTCTWCWLRTFYSLGELSNSDSVRSLASKALLPYALIPYIFLPVTNPIPSFYGYYISPSEPAELLRYYLDFGRVYHLAKAGNLEEPSTLNYATAITRGKARRRSLPTVDLAIKIITYAGGDRV